MTRSAVPVKKKTSTSKSVDDAEFLAWFAHRDQLRARAELGDAYAQATLLADHYRTLARELPPSGIAWTATSLRETKAKIAKAWAAVFVPTPAAERIALMRLIDYLARAAPEEGHGELGPIVRAWLDEAPGAKKTGSGISKWKMLANHFAKRGEPVTARRLKTDWLEYKKTNGE